RVGLRLRLGLGQRGYLEGRLAARRLAGGEKGEGEEKGGKEAGGADHAATLAATGEDAKFVRRRRPVRNEAPRLRGGAQGTSSAPLVFRALGLRGTFFISR